MQNLVFSGLLVLALGVSAFFWFQKQQIPTVSPRLEDTNIIISDLKTRRYSMKGGLEDILYARQARSKTAKLDEIELTYPVLEVFDPNQNAQMHWHVSAKNALLTDRVYLTLNHDIVLNDLIEDNLLKSIETPSLAIDLQQKTVINNSPIRFIGTTFESSGIGVEGSLKTHFFQILSQSHAIYNTP